MAEKRIPNFVGIKHSSRELTNAHKCVLLNPKRLQVLIGSDVVCMNQVFLPTSHCLCRTQVYMRCVVRQQSMEAVDLNAYEYSIPIFYLV